MNKDYLKNRIDFLLNQGQKVVQTKRYYEMFGDAVDSGLQMGFRTA